MTRTLLSPDGLEAALGSLASRELLQHISAYPLTIALLALATSPNAKLIVMGGGSAAHTLLDLRGVETTAAAN